MRPVTLVALSLLAGQLQAQTSLRYFYDDANELFRVLDSTGTLIEYVYDPSGNITQINRSTVSSTSLSILNVTPLSGVYGGTLTIYGQNFSGNPVGDIVMINGQLATVVSATSTQIVVQIPQGATMGQITVTVNGVTVSSGPTLIFSPIPPAVISLLSPNTAPGGGNVTITVTGTNLYSASFYFANGLGIVTSVTNNGTGTSATLQATLANTQGLDNILAVNYLGTSIAGPSNQFTLTTPSVPAHGYAVSNPTISALNRIGEAGTSLTTGPPISVLNGIGQPGTNLTAGPPVSILNSISQPGTSLTTGPPISALNLIGQPGTNLVTGLLSALNSVSAPGGAAAMSPWISVSNTNSSGNSNVSSSSRSRTPSNLVFSRPTLTLAGASGAAVAAVSVVPGQTMAMNTSAGQSGQSILLLNGNPVDEPAHPATLRFTVPFGVSTIKASVSDGPTESDPIEFEVRTTTPRTLRGRLLLPGGPPAADRSVEIRSSGLTAEYFDWKTPLTEMPSLTNLQADRTGFVSSLSMENPNGVFGVDPFGTGMAPDYAARFTGFLRADTAGAHTFILTSHVGSRLWIDGQMLLDATLTSGTATSTGIVQLTAGWHAIEVDHFEGAGAPQLRLEWERPGFAQETVDPNHLTPARSWSSHSDERGNFVISDFPAFLDLLEFRATCEVQCSIVMEPNQ